jgi:hypothetical protein
LSELPKEVEERVATIDAPPEELKAFTAGLRVGYKKGFEAGYAQRLVDERIEAIEATQPTVEPSEVLFNKPKKMIQ